MRKAVGVVLLMVVLSVMAVGVAAADTAQPAAARVGVAAGEYMDVSGIVPFSAEANFMSLTGYLRWTVLRDQHVMLTRVEAQRIVTAQQG